MKKFLAILLVFALVLCSALLVYAMAEAPEVEPAPIPLVNLTGVVVALVLLIGDFLLAWIAKVIVPPIRRWIESHTTKEQRGLMWDAVCELVDAAEQTIRGPARGPEKFAYVNEMMRQRGFTVDKSMIEAALKRMGARTLDAVGTAFGEPPRAAEE